jgi:GT2 family glycosyltransferase
MSAESTPARPPERGPARARATVASGELSVVVTTCAQGERAARVVASILACEHPPLEVIVVENRPGARAGAGASATATLLAARFPGDERVRCVEEPRQGLSRARNRGLRVARGEIVVFTDDDVVVDRGWLGAIAAAFAREPRAACVTGPIAALALASAEQRTFEQFTRLHKGSQRQVYAIERPPVGDPLFPFAAGRFGSGANIALRATSARALGGFDVCLGAGTRARGAEDLDLFIRVLRSGAELVYEPRALLRHEHADSQRELRRHAFDYGVGLAAMLTKQLLGEGRSELLRRVPAGTRYLLDPGSAKNATKDADYPRRLDLLELLGIAYGPLAYLASAISARIGVGR